MKKTVGVYLDLQKEFDTGNHDILTHCDTSCLHMVLEVLHWAGLKLFIKP